MATKKLETYSLKLTKLQRESILHLPLQKSLKKKFEQTGDGKQTIQLSWKQVNELEGYLSATAAFASGPFKQRLVTVLGYIHTLQEETALTAVTKPSQSRRPATDSSQLFQFKITLLSIKPPIWRRIVVPDGTLEELHLHIQTAFGWANYHMHQFTINGNHYGSTMVDMGFGLEWDDESAVVLSQLLPKGTSKARWRYEYDFGDDWQHDIVFEKHLAPEPGQTYPICTDGKRACPPEDCGGPWGYTDLPKESTDSTDEDSWDDYGDFDPEYFDSKLATMRMQNRY